MGSWQPGVGGADAGPSMRDHARYQQTFSSIGAGTGVVHGLSAPTQQPDPDELLPISNKRKKKEKSRESKCVVAITAKGLRFVGSKERLEIALPRWVIAAHVPGTCMLFLL